jgi:hypothetical protein
MNDDTSLVFSGESGPDSTIMPQWMVHASFPNPDHGVPFLWESFPRFGNGRAPPFPLIKPTSPTAAHVHCIFR